MTPEEYLARAADRVEQGWCQYALMQRKWGGRDKKYCLIGALICDSSGIVELGSSERNEALGALEKELNTYDLVGWNNAPDRIQEEVVSSIRNAKRWL